MSDTDAPDPGLGRRVPANFDHIDKHPLRLGAGIAAPAFTVNTFLKLPSMQHYYSVYDQGSEGACVGFGSSWAMTLLNRRAYAAHKLYTETQLVDEWDDTPPGEGTSVKAAMDVLRTRGHWRTIYSRKSHAYEIVGPNLEDGIEANKWTVQVDDVRACIKAGVPVVIGINWYSDFDKPIYDDTIHQWVIGRDPTSLGRIRGGHCVCLRAAVDRWNMVGGVNNWGAPEITRDSTTGHRTLVSGYPLFYMPYDTLARMLAEDGECTVITDRQSKPVTVGSINTVTLSTKQGSAVSDSALADSSGED